MPSRAFSELGWEPEVSFDELVKGMVESDLATHGVDSIDEARVRVVERFGDDLKKNNGKTLMVSSTLRRISERGGVG